MRLLRLAVENQRWDLAAHTIVLATAKLLNDKPSKSNQRGGDKAHVRRKKENPQQIKEQSDQ